MSLGTVQIGQFRMRCCSNKRERKLGGLQYLRRFKEYGKMNVNLSASLLAYILQSLYALFEVCNFCFFFKFGRIKLTLHEFFLSLRTCFKIS